MKKSIEKNQGTAVSASADKLLLEGPIPPEIEKAARNMQVSDEEKPGVRLFFSFDIVNSTRYKTMTRNWPLVIGALLDLVKKQVYLIETLSASYLWRIIGDEVVFVLLVRDEENITQAVKAIFEVTQRVSISLKSGKFFDVLSEKGLQQQEIDILKSQNMLSVKAAAWLAVVSDALRSPYDNIVIARRLNESDRQHTREYLGQDVDTGFRIKHHTQDRRLALSFELAYLLKEKSRREHLHIMDYVRLKGVWNEALYPVIWYYNAEVVKTCQFELLSVDKAPAFDDSFRYDETDHNELVKHYFLRQRSPKMNGEETSGDFIESDGFALDAKMYIADHALEKILADRNLLPKIEHIRKHFRAEATAAASALSG